MRHVKDQEIDMVTAETKTQSTRRTSYSYSKTEVPILSENDILIQKAFQCAAKIVKIMLLKEEYK